MIKTSDNPLLQLIRKVAEEQSYRELPDVELLRRFRDGRDEGAFHGLLRRHGPMVFEVCWNVLGNEFDAEDAFQATFLILAHKAHAIRKERSLGSWLHGVAHRTALKVLTTSARRKMHEGRAAGRSDAPAPDDLLWHEIRQAIHKELGEIAEPYRAPLVLCYLQGRTQDDAAALLGVCTATLKKRLDRGRGLLRGRLVRRGFGPAGVLATTSWHGAVRAGFSPALTSSLARAAMLISTRQELTSGLVSAEVAALVEGALKAMFVKKLKWVTVALLALGLVALGGGWWSYDSIASPLDPPQKRLSEVASAPEPAPEGNAKKPAMITDEAQRAIDAGLIYLARVQADNGSFGTGRYSGNLAVTGLAGLAFLGSEQGRTKHKEAVSRTIEYVLKNEDPKQPGYFMVPQSAFHGPMYSHAFAVLFLAEAHGLTADKKLKKRLNESLDRAVRLTVAAQNIEGGWRYMPQPRDADLSVTACQVLALCAARDAGIAVPRGTLDKAAAYLKSCQDVEGDGGFRYQRAGGPSNFGRTGAALACLRRLGVQEDAPIKKGMEFLRRWKPGSGKLPDPPMYYDYAHYYAAKAMFRANPKDWQEWYPAIRDELLQAAPKGKHEADNSWSGPLDPHYSTALSIIILQMPNSALPSLKGSAAK